MTDDNWEEISPGLYIPTGKNREWWENWPNRLVEIERQREEAEQRRVDQEAGE